MNIKYGNTTIQLDIKNFDILHKQVPEAPICKDYIKKNIYENILNVDLKGNILIIVPDRTRGSGIKDILDILIPMLKGRKDIKKIDFLIAYGAHKKQAESVSKKIYGIWYETYNFYHHDAKDEKSLFLAGETSSGTKVYLNTLVKNYDRIITISQIALHYFAGYGGGRKLIFPGIAGFSSIQQNHGMIVDPKTREKRKGVEIRNIEENPIAKDIEEAASFIDTHFDIIYITSPDGSIIKVGSGKKENIFKKMIEAYDYLYLQKIDKEYDFIILSCGGYPKDIDLVQIHKSIYNATFSLKKNGVLLVFCKGEEGTGSKELEKWLSLNDEELINKLIKDYTANGTTVFSYKRIAKNYQVFMYTDIEDDIIKKIGFKKVSLQEALDLIKAYESDSSLNKAIIPYGGYFLFTKN